MNKNDNLYADATMMIRRPVKEVFEAFVDPEITSRFWFSKGSGKLIEGTDVLWTWTKYNLDIPLKVIKVEKNKNILINWGADPEDVVEWIFEKLEENKTQVTVLHRGFKGRQDELISAIRDSSGGFNLMIAAAKAWLEYKIELNVVNDKMG